MMTAMRRRSWSLEERRWPGVLRPMGTPLIVGLLLVLSPHASTLGVPSIKSRSSSSMGMAPPAYACTTPVAGLRGT